MPIFMKVEGMKGDVVEAAPSRTGGTADDVVVDGRIITGENWDSAATESFSLNYSKIDWSDAAATEPGLVTTGETETQAGDHAKWTELTSFSSGSLRSSDTEWDRGLHVVASDFDVI